jgi:hypothetical protein
LLRSDNVGNGRITGVQRLMDGGSIPPSSTSCFLDESISIPVRFHQWLI